MKLKYYLRGIGIGVLVTTLIFMVSISIHKNDVERKTQDDTKKSETVAQANKETESVASTESLETESVASTESLETESGIPPSEVPVQPENKQNIEVQPETDDTPVEPVPESGEIIQFTVGRGEFSDIIAGKLAEQKLVDNAEAFNKFLIEKNYDNFILPGTYAIPMDSTYEEIAALLTTKVE